MGSPPDSVASISHWVQKSVCDETGFHVGGVCLPWFCGPGKCTERSLDGKLGSSCPDGASYTLPISLSWDVVTNAEDRLDSRR